ncbi:hypothetical protein MMC10_007284 [Thelotrema lepadinum]|nr:hypothetical protein [Thelotrema lepadinum]
MPQMQSEPPTKKRRMSALDDSTPSAKSRAPKRRSLRLQRLSPENINSNAVESMPTTKKPPIDAATRAKYPMAPPPKTPRKNIERVVPSSQSPIATPLSLRRSPRHVAFQSESPLKTRSTNIIMQRRVSKADKDVRTEPSLVNVQDTYYEKENSQITTQDTLSRANSRLSRINSLHSDQDWAIPISQTSPGSSVRKRVQRNPQHLTTKSEVLNSDEGDGDDGAKDGNGNEDDLCCESPAEDAMESFTPSGPEAPLHWRLESTQSAKRSPRVPPPDAQDRTQSQARDWEHEMPSTPKRTSKPQPDSRQEQTSKAEDTLQFREPQESQNEPSAGARRSIKTESHSQADRSSPNLGDDPWYKNFAVNSLEGVDLNEVEEPIGVSKPQKGKLSHESQDLSHRSEAEKDRTFQLEDDFGGKALYNDFEDLPDYSPPETPTTKRTSEHAPAVLSQHVDSGPNLQSDSQQAAAQLESEIQWHTQHPGPVVETESQFQDAWRMFSPPQPAPNSDFNLEEENLDAQHADREVVLIQSSPPPRLAPLPHNSIPHRAGEAQTRPSQATTADLTQAPIFNQPTPSQATTASVLSSPIRKNKTPTQALLSSQYTPSSPLETPRPSHGQGSPEIIAIPSSPIPAEGATRNSARPGRRQPGDETPEHERILRQARENIFLRDLLIKPMTDSQMYPDSIMNFELPRIPQREDDHDMRYEGDRGDEEL